MKMFAVALCLFLTLTMPSTTLANHDTCGDSLCRNITIMVNGQALRCVVCGSVARCS